MATIDDLSKFKPDPLDLMELMNGGDPADVIMDNKLKGVKERKKNKVKKEMEAAGEKPTEEDIEKAASEAMKDLKEAGKAQVNAMFENVKSQFTEITALAIAIPAALAGLIAQLALIDPMAPVASMGVVNSAIANIKNLKGQINTFKTTVSNFTQNLGKLDITLPESISEASSAVNDASEEAESTDLTEALVVKFNPIGYEYVEMTVDGETVEPKEKMVRGQDVTFKLTDVYDQPTEWRLNGKSYKKIDPADESTWTITILPDDFKTGEENIVEIY